MPTRQSRPSGSSAGSISMADASGDARAHLRADIGAGSAGFG